MPVYPPIFTDQQIANQLTRDGLHWASGTITYSFDNYSTAGNELNATYQLWIERAIALVEEVIGLDFVETAGVGDITFNGSYGNGTYAASVWNGANKAFDYSDIYFDREWVSNQPEVLSYGSYGFMTIIHEFLHAIGLEHPGAYNGSGNYFPDAEFKQDTHRYSVMSYFDADNDGSGTTHFLKEGGTWVWQYPQTPMVYDILALTDGNFAGYFAGYSFNATTRAGSTTYGYNATSGINGVYNFSTNTGPVLTIYDAGGTDTLDLSGDTVTTSNSVTYDVNGAATFSEITRTTSVIDLRPGNYSSTNGMTNNIGIAFGTIIENAIGTNFNDTIYGNNFANTLYGRDGADSIFGGFGADFIDGGAGGDTLNGEDNFDTLNYSSSTAAVRVNLGANTATGGYATGDVISNFEILVGSAFNDFLIAGGAGWQVNGGNGNDYLSAGFGGTATGGAGADWFVFQNDNNGPAFSGAVADKQAGDFIYVGGSSASLTFSLSGANVLAGGITIVGAATGNVSVITQAASTFLNTANVTQINSVLSGGLSALGAFGTYIVNTFDANSNDVWRTTADNYTTSNLLDFTSIIFDVGQTYNSSKIDYDQAINQIWSQVDTYFSATSVIDFYTTVFDAGQTYHSNKIDLDQAVNQVWTTVDTYLSASGIVDFYNTYFDAGQTYHSSKIDLDQSTNQVWTTVDTYFSAAGVIDFYTTYFDAGQGFHSSKIDYDQGLNQSWTRLDTYFSAAGVIDQSWAYNDAGNPIASRFTDYDQSNAYSWTQHIIDYNSAGAIVAEYFI